MKRCGALVALILLLCLVSSCGISEAVPTSQVIDPAIPEQVFFHSDFPEELQQYCAPWFGDIPADAVADGKLHYYFMSGKGMLMDPDESDPYKWGDSTLIVFPNGQTMLIDVGMQAYAPVLAENLRRMGVDKLDYLMITHPHGDHCDGLIGEDSLLDWIPVATVLYSGVIRGEKSDQLYAACAQREIPITILEQGDTMSFGAVQMQVLWPAAGTAGTVITRTESINNQSIVVRFDYMEHSSLFVGDLYTSGETAVVAACLDQLDADLLKVPHHGYTTSSSAMFIHAVSPEIAVAMSGYVPAIQRRYEARGVMFLYDRYEGYIHIMSDGSSMSYKTDRTIQ